MARPWAQLASVLLIVSVFRLNLSGVVFSALDVFESSDDHRRPPMVLPLYLSPVPPNDSSSRAVDGDLRRRHLQKSESSHVPNARMRLYDDLLSNGYYTTRLWIGTPPQEFALIVDTGSTVTYVPCSSCEHCGMHQDPRFQPESSSTYEPIKCNINCNCDKKGAQCTYERRYAEMSSSSGVLGEDVVSFGNESELTPQRAVFGCENVETGDLYRQRADGIMGLGRGRMSIVDQLVDKDVISDSFSLCYGGMDVGGGAMILGGISPPHGMVFSRSDPFRSPYYNIELKEIHVAGSQLKLNPRIFDGRHGTVLDSGTTYAYLPGKAFAAFKDAIIKNTGSLKQIHGPDPNYNDVCFSGAGRDVAQLSKVFPEVDMIFSSGQKLLLSPENYLFRHTKVSGAYCLGIFPNGKDPTTLLGGIVVRNTLVTYDRENDKIGFWKTNCSELWKRLHIPSSPALAPPPPPPPPTPPPTPPPVSPSHNASTGTPPTLAPSGLPQNILPGEFRIGVITFDISYSISNSHLKPNFTELAEFLAYELEVDTSQVHLLNFTFKGNDSLIRWAIFPAESADYFSNTTAMSIIMRLKEHRMRLPEKFGSYELVEWKVGPHQKPTWWQQHTIAMAVGVAFTIVLSLSFFGIWLYWRHRQQQALGTYEPVGAVVREQELQPL